MGRVVLSGYVSGEMTQSNARNERAWEMMDRKVMATIIELIDPGQTQLIMTCTSSRQMWEKLGEVNESTGPTRLMKLMREVHYGQFQENGDIKERINTYFANIEKLAIFGVTFNDRSVSLMLLESLPPNLECFDRR